MPFIYADTSQAAWCCHTLLHSSVAQSTIAVTNAESCTEYTLGTAQPAQADAAAAAAEVAVAAKRQEHISVACSRKTHQVGSCSVNTLCTSPGSSLQSGPCWQPDPSATVPWLLQAQQPASSTAATRRCLRSVPNVFVAAPLAAHLLHHYKKLAYRRCPACAARATCCDIPRSNSSN